ncbi:hypothetical protein [Bradyrhizobium stylosanthis]|uniref:hypothetical protein n=1 Tax=Bradyrhizobium stylosanthis TaxID=1803665 RepID=UPI0011A4CDA5|nr:hypothetical protein [Bradyrhizobium stylosanthis]
MHEDSAQTRYLDTSDAAACRVGFVPSTHLTAGSTNKAHQAIRLVKSTFRGEFKCLVTQVEAGIIIECPEATECAILNLCIVVEQRLERLKQEPLAAKMVEEILAVSSAELRRWSKDGRIPTSGRAYFSQGRKQVGLFLYSPEVIRGLSSRPDQIAQWRNQDR